MNKNKEKYCNLIYNKILKDIVKPISGNKTTYLSELLAIGKKLFGVKFKGVFPSDKIPKLNDLSPYAILNLDRSTESGSHWVAIAKHGDNTYLYDSFGRKHTQIIPNLYYSGNGKIIDTDNDAEQKVYEIDCGARSIGWLLFFDKWGPECALLI
jgi:hypothetical protein